MIGIRADGNANLGMGHLMRCCSIANALEKQGEQCVFFVADEKAGKFLQEKGVACEVLHSDYRKMEAEVVALKEAAQKYAISMWLIDSYQITQRYLEQLQEMCPVFYLDDTAEQIYQANGLINYNVYGESLGYEKFCPKGMNLLLGAGYAPIKEEFGKTAYQIKPLVSKVLITMGGSDMLNITGSLCKKLLEYLPQEIEFTLICGRFNPHLQELLALQEGSRVKVLVDVPDMWNKLAQADVVVSAAGSTLYEVSAMGVPTVTCYYVENQRRGAEAFAQKAGMCNAGDYSESPQEVLERLAGEVCLLVQDFPKRQVLSAQMKQVADGKGAKRLAKALLTYLEN